MISLPEDAGLVVLKEFLKHQPEDFWAGCLADEFNGEALDLQKLPAWPDGDALVCLRIMVSSK